MIEYPGANWKDYELLDSGRGEKLERFGAYVLARPEPKALWDKSMSEDQWRRLTHTSFTPGAGFGKAGKEDSGTWNRHRKMDDQWYISYPGLQDGLKFDLRLGLTSFKHVGVFPEQAPNWEWIYRHASQSDRSLVDGGSAPVTATPLSPFDGGSAPVTAAPLSPFDGGSAPVTPPGDLRSLPASECSTRQGGLEGYAPPIVIGEACEAGSAPVTAAPLRTFDGGSAPVTPPGDLRSLAASEEQSYSPTAILASRARAMALFQYPGSVGSPLNERTRTAMEPI